MHELGRHGDWHWPQRVDFAVVDADAAPAARNAPSTTAAPTTTPAAPAAASDDAAVKASRLSGTRTDEQQSDEQYVRWSMPFHPQFTFAW